jgi:hypothetical protein
VRLRERGGGQSQSDWNKSYGLGTTDLRNLWYGFVGKGTINKVDWNEGRVTALLGRDGPNRVRWIFSYGGEVTEGLAVIEPCLSSLGGGVRKIDGHVLIRLIEALVAFFAEILEGLDIYEFLIIDCQFLESWFCLTFVVPFKCFIIMYIW